MKIFAHDPDAGWFDVVDLDTGKTIDGVTWADDESGEYEMFRRDQKGDFVDDGVKPFIELRRGRIKLRDRRVETCINCQWRLGPLEPPSFCNNKESEFQGRSVALDGWCPRFAREEPSAAAKALKEYPEMLADVEARLGGREICRRCGATLATYEERCAAPLDEQCEGFKAIEAARLMARSKAR
jgi:ribosomal protein L40E